MTLPGQVDDLTRVETEQVEYDGLSGYLARPTGVETAPGVLVIHELFGINEHVRDVTRRFANVGYVALAPNLYSRIGPPEPQEDLDAGRDKLRQLVDEQVAADIAASAQYLRSRDDATGKVGSIGFCSGGRYSLLAAFTTDALDAAVDCWGGFITQANPHDETTPNRPVPVVDLAAGLSCPLLAVFGIEDDTPSPEQAEVLRQRLEAGGKASQATIHIYEDAGHAFFADYRPSYREGPAFELWTELLDFFRARLS
jgi:carboxymethylenebutenolidase